MIIKVGCCGFPGGKKKYFSQFRLVEVQQTFYKLPRLKTVKKWVNEAPEGFEFTIKAWQVITHPHTSPTWRKIGKEIPEKKREKYGFFKPTDEVFEAWVKTKEIAETLKSKIVVFQSPPSFSCIKENIENMDSFFSSIDRGKLLLGWEARGEWLERKDEIAKVCRENSLIHIVDLFWDNPCTTTEISYFRLHGLGRRYNYKTKYKKEDLNQLLRKIKEIGCETNYVLFNNVYMSEDAQNFLSLVKRFI